MTGLDQRVVVARHDGSLGPLLRIADDRLPPGVGYGVHDHRAVDVVAVVLSGSLVHRWESATALAAGDVGLLRAGRGLEHEERAGDDGARVLQCYLRSADPGAPPSHAVVSGADGWVDLARADARLWVGPARGEVPDGLRLVVRDDEVAIGGDARDGAGVVVVWQLDVRRPDWAF